MFFLVPASRSVISLILARTLSKSVIFSVVLSKTAHGLSSIPAFYVFYMIYKDL